MSNPQNLQNEARVINLPLSDADASKLRMGEKVVLSGRCYTVRDASIARLATAASILSGDGADQSVQQHEEMPAWGMEAARLQSLLAGQLIFFAGPTPSHPNAPDVPFGSIGPTTATRMDAAQVRLMSYGFTQTLGKGMRSETYKQAARTHGAVYFTAVGGAAALLAQHVTASKVVGWSELGTEAVMQLTLKDFPAVVAIDAAGSDLFTSEGINNPEDFAAYNAPASDMQEPKKPHQPNTPGTLITFEGGEGAGKSTQIRLLEQLLTAAGHKVLILREPGSSPLSEAIRTILLDAKNTDLADRAELLLYEAARAQLTEEVIKPALEAGQMVLCDRFYDSTTAYQGYARGLDTDQIDYLNAYATQNITPNLTFVLDLDPSLGLARAAKTGTPDRLESEAHAFHLKVREGFLRIAEREPDRVKVLDATLPTDELAHRIRALLAEKGIG